MQILAVPGVQVPFWHVSPVVQALPSLQGVPFAFGVDVQMLLTQVPGLWQSSAAPEQAEPQVTVPQELVTVPQFAPVGQTGSVQQSPLTQACVPLVQQVATWT